MRRRHCNRVRASQRFAGVNEGRRSRRGCDAAHCAVLLEVLGCARRAAARITLQSARCTTTGSDWRELPVWKCPDDACGKQWASADRTSSCPFCHSGLGDLAGFTCGEAADAAERFGFGELAIHIAEPVPDLVQLSTLPRVLWVGLPVFHPCAQDGLIPNWLRYDVGVVVDVSEDRDFAGEFTCRLAHSNDGNGGTLRYPPHNLWVPTALAQRLHQSPRATDECSKSQ